MNIEDDSHRRQLLSVRVLMPVLGVLTFLTLMAIAEYQIRPRRNGPLRHDTKSEDGTLMIRHFGPSQAA